MFLDATKFISRGEGVVLTTPPPPSPPASSMVRLPKHPARNPACSGQQMGCGEQWWRGLHQAPPATDEWITFPFRNIRRDPCSPQRKAPALWGRRHRAPRELPPLWAHSHPPCQQAPWSSTPPSPGASIFNSSPKSHPPVTHNFLCSLSQPLSYSLSLHTVSPLAEMSLLGSSPKELLFILQDTRQECPFPWWPSWPHCSWFVVTLALRNYSLSIYASVSFCWIGCLSDYICHCLRTCHVPGTRLAQSFWSKSSEPPLTGVLVSSSFQRQEDWTLRCQWVRPGLNSVCLARELSLKAEATCYSSFSYQHCIRPMRGAKEGSMQCYNTVAVLSVMQDECSGNLLYHIVLAVSNTVLYI